MSESEIRIERWVMIVAGSGARWLGVPDHPPRTHHVDPTPLDCSSREGRGAIVSDLATGNPILLSPAFEVLMMMSGGPGGAPQRTSLVCPVDLAAQGVPVYVRAESVYFLAELQEDDRRTYLRLIAEGFATQQRARVMRAGLLTAPPR